MKYFFVFLLLAAIAGCQSGPGHSAPVNGDSVRSGTGPSGQPESKNGFLLLKGTIGTYPVTFYLFSDRETYSGYYYYDAKELPIYFHGTDTASSGKLELTAYNESDSLEAFSLTFDGREATGNWSMSGKTLPVSLVKADMPFQFAYTGLKDSAVLSDTIRNSPKANGEAYTVWPAGNSATDRFIQKQIALLYDEKNPANTAEGILKSYLSGYFKEYREDSFNREDLEVMGERLNYELLADMRVAYLSHRLMALSFAVSSYTGGAHGNHATFYRPLDLQNRKVLTLTDILKREGIQQLRPLLENTYRRQHGLEPGQSLHEDGGLLVDKIEPNDNFYVTGKGLVFSYSPYEIAPYAAGEVVLMIPYTQLHAYLQPAFTALLQ